VIEEIYENRDIAEKYSAMSAPRTFVGEPLVSPGLQTEEYFAESLIEGKHVEYEMPTGREGLKDYDVVVIGAGSTGLTAALYMQRAI